MSSIPPLEQYRADVPEYVRLRVLHLRAQHKRITQLERELNGLRKDHADLRSQLEPYRIGPLPIDAVPAEPEVPTLSSQSVSCAIDQYPDDLLYLIFEEYVSLPKNHEFIWRLFLTCKRWHNIVMSSPKLWARIDISDPLTLLDIVGRKCLLPYVSTCITRSGANPLAVSLDMESISPGNYISWKIIDYAKTIVDETRYDFIGDSFLNDSWGVASSWFDIKLDQAFDILMGSEKEHIKRWEKLNLRLPEGNDAAVDLWRRFGKWLQNTKQLSIHGIPDGWTTHPFYTSHVPVLPNLRHLELNTTSQIVDFTISPIGVLPQKLRHLNICVDFRLIPMPELSSFTQLRELKIICFGISDYYYLHSSLDLPSLVLSLPRLEILTLVGGYGILVNVNFNLPSLDILRLEIRGRASPLLNLSPRRIRLMPPLWVAAGYELKDVARDLILQSSILESITIHQRNKADIEEVVAQCKREGKSRSLRQIILEGDNAEVEILDV